MLDHVSLGVSDIGRSRNFYDAALRPLGLVRIVDFGDGRGSDYGEAPGSTGVQFTITREVAAIVPSAGSHLCFRAPDRTAVRAFHSAALCSRRPRRWRPRLAPVSCALLWGFHSGSRRSSHRSRLSRAGQTSDRMLKTFESQACGPAASIEEVEAGNNFRLVRVL
jgi:hypothetical protein